MIRGGDMIATVGNHFRHDSGTCYRDPDMGVSQREDWYWEPQQLSPA